LSSQLDGKVPMLVLPTTVSEQADAKALADWMDGLVLSLLPLAKR
jgi:hypothetical protein